MAKVASSPESKKTSASAAAPKTKKAVAAKSSDAGAKKTSKTDTKISSDDTVVASSVAAPMSKKMMKQKMQDESFVFVDAVFQRHEKDTGSPEFQIRNISLRIKTLQAHVEKNRKDYDSQRALIKLVAERRRHLKYLKANNLSIYIAVSNEIGLKV